MIKNELQKKKNETLYDALIEKQITPLECIREMHKPCMSIKQLEIEVSSAMNGKREKTKTNINQVSKMNFLELRRYKEYLISKNVNIQDLMHEIYLRWDNGEISGFDYRYIIESLETKPPDEFEEFAKKIGRYGK